MEAVRVQNVRRPGSQGQRHCAECGVCFGGRGGVPPPVSRPGLAGVRASCGSPVLSLLRLHVTQPYVADLGMSTDPRRGTVK